MSRQKTGSPLKDARRRTAQQHAVRLKTAALGPSELRVDDAQSSLPLNFSHLEYLVVENYPSTVLLVLASIIKSRPADFRSTLVASELANELEKLATRAGKFEIHPVRRRAKVI
jgi:hypothetical protein